MDVLVLIDKLDDLVHNAKAVPLTDQVRIDREEIYDILDQMRATIPEEIKQARWIVKERQEMLAEAKKEAERIIKDARERQERLLSEENLARVRALNEIAGRRGQSLAQLAIAWALRHPRVSSALIGASSVTQLEQNVAALENLDFTTEELAEIDRYAVDGGIDLWEPSRSA